jgi:hypothetical protein
MLRTEHFFSAQHLLRQNYCTCGNHAKRLLQSASFFTPTLGDDLRLLTNNGATSSEPPAHKNAPNSFFGHQVGPVKEAESNISKPRGKKTTKKIRATGTNEKATISKCAAKVYPPGNL